MQHPCFHLVMQQYIGLLCILMPQLPSAAKYRDACGPGNHLGYNSAICFLIILLLPAVLCNGKLLQPQGV